MSLEAEPYRQLLLAQRTKTPDGCWVLVERKGPRPCIAVMGRKVAVHRVAAWVWLGLDLDDGASWALHHCDNGRCFNPDHLYVGDQADNVADALSRGRYPLGFDRANAKLSDADVREIRRLLKQGVKQKEIMEEYHVSQGLVSRIGSGQRRHRAS